MKTSKIHSFCTSSKEDEDYVEELKRQCIKEGKKFSWLVVQALKSHTQKAKKVRKPNEAK